MEPRREGQKPDSRAGEKPKRFRLIKLEERIAPKAGGIAGKETKRTCPFVDATCVSCGIEPCFSIE